MSANAQTRRLDRPTRRGPGVARHVAARNATLRTAKALFIERQPTEQTCRTRPHGTISRSISGSSRRRRALGMADLPGGFAAPRSLRVAYEIPRRGQGLYPF